MSQQKNGVTPEGMEQYQPQRKEQQSLLILLIPSDTFEHAQYMKLERCMIDRIDWVLQTLEK